MVLEGIGGEMIPAGEGGRGISERGLLGERAAAVGILANTFLSFWKLFVGFSGGSTAVLADALDSFSDTLMAGLTWVGLRLSRRPPDSEHPYGHWDIEPIVGFSVSLLLVLVGFEFGRHALGIFLSGAVAPPAPLALYGMALDLVLKAALAAYTLRIGQRIRSPALEANAANYRMDLYKSATILLGIALSRSAYPLLDPLMGVGVSLLILLTGVRVGRENLLQLMGTVPSPEMRRRIEAVARENPQVRHVHRVRIHGMGAYSSVDLHVCVEEGLTFEEAHRIAHQVQNRITNAFPEILTALVHVEPFDRHHVQNHLWDGS
jgi:cation diffusion facilitator family transporter